MINGVIVRAGSRIGSFVIKDIRPNSVVINDDKSDSVLKLED